MVLFCVVLCCFVLFFFLSFFLLFFLQWLPGVYNFGDLPLSGWSGRELSLVSVTTIIMLNKFIYS